MSTRVLDRGDDDAIAHVLGRLEEYRTVGLSVFYGLGHVVDAPVGRGARAGLVRWHEAEFVARDFEADVERLIEVGRESEVVRPPRLGRGEVGCRIDEGAKTAQWS